MNIVFFCYGDESAIHQSIHLVASAKRVMPDAKLIQLSDPTTPQTPGTHMCIRTDLSQFEFLRARVELHNAFVQGCMTDNTVFTDIDILINQDLTPVFDGSFDIGLTWRVPPENIPDQHFNAGAIFTANTPGARRFHELVRDDIAGLPQEFQHWWGDQLSLVNVVGEQRFLQRTSDCIEVEGVRIRFFPCETHNYTPSSFADDDFSGKYIIHYKGDMKQYIAQAWKRLLAEDSSPVT